MGPNIDIPHEFIEKDYSKLFKWKGFKEELFWIIFFIALFAATYGYYDLYKRHQELLAMDCVWDCRVEEFINYYKEEDPNLQIVCFKETRSCEFYGVDKNMLPEELQSQFKEEIDSLNDTS